MIKYKKGLSVLELLIVIAIISVISFIVFFGFKSFSDKQVLNTESRRVATLIQEGRIKTLASIDSSAHGIHIVSDSATLFQGVFATGTATNQEIELNNRLEFVVDINGGGNDILFNKLTGKTDTNGTATIRFINDTSKYLYVVVNEGGLVEIKK